MGILRITVEDNTRIEATSARLHLTIAGSSSFVGGTALRKAAEVRELVGLLAEHGVGEDAFEVVGLNAENGSGILVKAQRVAISLTLTVLPEQLGAVLGTLTARPGVRIDELEWRYDEFEASITAATAAMAKARRKGEALAAAAGQRIVGIAEISDSWNRHAPRMVYAAAATRSQSMAKAAPELDLGLDLTSTTELSVHLSVDFQIGD